MDDQKPKSMFLPVAIVLLLIVATPFLLVFAAAYEHSVYGTYQVDHALKDLKIIKPVDWLYRQIVE